MMTSGWGRSDSNRAFTALIRCLFQWKVNERVLHYHGAGITTKTVRLTLPEGILISVVPNPVLRRFRHR